MKIDAATSYFAAIDGLSANRRTQTSVADRPAATSVSASPSATPADGSVRQVDFTSMTRQELRDWVNAQIRSGTMSLDDSRPFMAMTMKIEVASGRETDAASDATRYDFTQKIRDGIQGALSRNDEASLKMLESAMQIIWRNQGQTVGVDIRA